MDQFGYTRWFALHVRSRHEKTVDAQLQAKSHESFLPLYTAKTKWTDRTKDVSLPLFPGYVFCRFQPSDKSSILATSGIIDLVRIGSEPAALQTSEIDAIKLIVQSRLQAEPSPKFIKGQEVMLMEGPLSGLVGTLTNVRNSTRLVVSVDLLCRSVQVEIDRNWVMPQTAKTPTFAPAAVLA